MDKILVLLFMFAAYDGHSQNNYGDHVFAGGVISLFSAPIGCAIADNPNGAYWSLIPVATAATWREVQGMNTPGGRFDAADWGFTMLGGIIISFGVKKAWSALTKRKPR